MKLVRFEVDGKVYSGKLDGNVIEPWGSSKALKDYQLDKVRLLAPCRPTKVVAVGLNYRDHIIEMGHQMPEEPVIFLKPSSSVIGPDDFIILPSQSFRVDHESEFAVVIGKTASHVSRENAKDFILGYTCLNDVTARDLQSKDGQWTRAKGFDTFCPIGPWIETDVNPGDLSVELFLNGERRQASRTSNLIFDPYFLVEFISGIMQLNPGDVIATGTPSGVGPLSEGDKVEVRIEGIGSLFNIARNRR